MGREAGGSCTSKAHDAKEESVTREIFVATLILGFAAGAFAAFGVTTGNKQVIAFSFPMMLATAITFVVGLALWQFEERSKRKDLEYFKRFG